MRGNFRLQIGGTLLQTCWLYTLDPENPIGVICPGNVTGPEFRQEITQPQYATRPAPEIFSQMAAAVDIH